MKKSWIAVVVILSMLTTMLTSQLGAEVSYAAGEPELGITSAVSGGTEMNGSRLIEVGSTGKVAYTLTPGGGIHTKIRSADHVVMVIDTSGSMNEIISGTTKTRLEALKEASVNFLTHMRNNGVEGDKVTIISFASGVAIPSEYAFTNTTDSYTDAISEINGLTADGGTNYDKALSDAGDYLSQSVSEKRTVLFFTDGSPTNYIGNELYNKKPKKVNKIYLRETSTKKYTHMEGEFDVYYLKDGKWFKGTGTTTLWIEGDQTGKSDNDYHDWNQANNQQWRPTEVTGEIKTDLPTLENLYRWDDGNLRTITIDMPVYSKIPAVAVTNLGTLTTNPSTIENRIWYNSSQETAKGGVTYLNAEFDVFQFNEGQIQKGKASTTLYQYGNYQISPLWDSNAPEKWFSSGEVRSKWLQSSRFVKSTITWSNLIGERGEPRADYLYKWAAAGGAEQDILIADKWYEYTAGTGLATSEMEIVKAQEAADELEASGITVHTVSFGGNADQNNLMAKISSSGGLSLTSTNATGLNDSFNKIAETITEKHLDHIILSGKLPKTMTLDKSALINNDSVYYVDGKYPITFNENTGEYQISVEQVKFLPDTSAPPSFTVTLPFKVIGQGESHITTKLNYNDIDEHVVERINISGSVSGKSLVAPTFLPDKTAPTNENVNVTISYDTSSQQMYFKKVLEGQSPDAVAYISANVGSPTVTVNENRTTIYAYSTYGHIMSPVTSYTVNNIDRSTYISIDTVVDSDMIITGKTEPGASLIVNLDMNGYSAVTAGGDGKFTINLTTPAIVGKTVKAVATDTAGNTGEATATVVAGDRGITSNSDKHKLTTTQNGRFITKLLFTRTTESTAPIVIRVDGAEGRLKKFTAPTRGTVKLRNADVAGGTITSNAVTITKNASDGSFTLTPTKALPKGNYTIQLVFSTNDTALGKYDMSLEGATSASTPLSVLVIKNPNIK